MTEPAITPELVAKHNLTPEEYAKILEILGREPSFTELGIFSVMWSEHCSYKNTKPLLRTFPTQSPKVLVGAGEENAGILDIGDGLGVAFKMESHNHPSAVEPFQGAATGVGGILRDIFTMGARPIAALDSLRFGEITNPEVRRLFSGVVGGIAHYGNCFGIPTVAGEVYFDRTFEGNPLVNVFCLGVLRHEQIARGQACGVGNPVFYVGPATGRDGLAGAAFASQDLTEESAQQQRGAVQVGDPFMEKLVCEACLELLATGAVAGIQDMGAAGLTCSTCETAGRAGTGIEIELTRVPQRAPDMTPYEIMLSESQERMLIIVHKGREEEVKRIFDKWDLPWSEIGFVTDTGHMVVKNHGQVVADIPARLIADESPVCEREAREPAYLREVRGFRLDAVPETTDALADLKALLAWPTIASKNWVYRQYDHMVRNGSTVCPGSDAAVIRVKADSVPALPADAPQPAPFADKFLAITSDCNAAHVYLDPYEGSKGAVAEAARNLVCSGAVPLGVTDNLNFGNPHNPELFWQLREAVRGLADGCRAFDTPVTGGNCSLYNQNPKGPIDPVPTVAMVGLIEKPEHITTQWFKDEGDAIILLGEPVDGEDPLLGLGGSAWLQVRHGRKTGIPPRCDLEQAGILHTTLLGLIRAGGIKSAHDCSEGGLAVCVAESCMSRLEARHSSRLIGAQVDLTPEPAPGPANGGEPTDKSPAAPAGNNALPSVRSDALLFGEGQNRVVVSCAELDAVKIVERARLMGVPARRIGTVGGEALRMKAGGLELSAPVAELHDIWWNSLGRAMA
ncbi:MAG: phosphoribosylformylglycinamidine synthase subunit PurL [Verrucomicrobiales bacterium]|nr:phosphoribosylformylglycinamidine synthase subunit PurL [Verrucomicrobiales bacterium]